MRFHIVFFRRTCFFLIFLFCLHLSGYAGLRTWTGYGGDGLWSNPLNWAGLNLPQGADDVLLDNGDLPVSYQVILPDVAVVIKSIRVTPSAGRNIELILPSTNKLNNAVTVSGPGYGIELDAGAVFRNASGVTSGESLTIADSIIIRDGGRYIHQTRASHAAGILSVLSTAPGTEQGIFDFDVPRASYTISVSNRTYGSLELHSTAQGSPVNYTCTGANPLLVRGNFRIGFNVNVSMNLSGINGNIQIEGDFIQEGGQLNLASGLNSQTALRIRGDLYQSPGTIITETNNGSPFIELNGNRLQQMATAGQITNQVGFRINNAAGVALRLPLRLPWVLDMKYGTIFTTSSALLTLGDNSEIQVDSTNTTGTYVDGPLCKTGLLQRDHFIFPVGKGGNIRWLELKNATGSYTAEYIHEDPYAVGNTLSAPLDHISRVEYWTILSEAESDAQTEIELSFASALSGGVSDPGYLNVARYESGNWEDAGHSGFTGDYQQGSVLSGPTDLSATSYTLASTAHLENPLPITFLELSVERIPSATQFRWTLNSSEKPDHFDLFDVTDSTKCIFTLKTYQSQNVYFWFDNHQMNPGRYFFKIRMTDVNGKAYDSPVTEYDQTGDTRGFQSYVAYNGSELILHTADSGKQEYNILSVDGKLMQKGSLIIQGGTGRIPILTAWMTHGIYVFRCTGLSKKSTAILFKI